MQRILDIFYFFKQPNDEESRFPHELTNEYMISEKILGRGTFAIVRECTEKQTGKKYALKILSKKTINNLCQFQGLTFSTELVVLRKIRHPNIVSLHDIYESKDEL